MKRVPACILIAVTALLLASFSQSQEPAAAAKPFNEQVVAKADKILADAGLRRSGKAITTTATADVARGMTGLTRSRRALKLVYDTWKQTSNQLAQLKRQSEQLNAENFQLNSQLALPGINTTSNNRLVGMINANVANMRQIETNEQRGKEKLATDRKALHDAEAAYAAAVLALRSDLNTIKSKLDEQLGGDQIKIALQVSNANFGTPLTLTTDALILPIDRKLQQIEQEIFSESISLDVTENGSLYVNVTVGDKTVRMVLDSGASVISLPSSVAAELNVVVPSDAPRIRLILADGREIPGRAVTLAKVRVGQFEAESVDAAVLDAVAVNAEPLLGMSFLANFKFEIDTADKSLKLLRVSAE